MKIPGDLLTTDFHDFILLAFEHAGSLVTIEMTFFEDDERGIEVETSAIAGITGVTRIVRNGADVDGVVSQAETADVLSLCQGDGQVTLNLRWADSPTMEDVYDFYVFHGPAIRLTAERVVADGPSR